MNMRVCTEIATGKLIEGQSGAAPYGTLRANALAAGYIEADIEERVVSQAEYQMLAAAAQPAPPGNAEIYDQALLDHPAFAALLLCISDGSIGPGATSADLKAAIVAKM